MLLEKVFHTFMDTLTISDTLMCGHPYVDLFRYTVHVQTIFILEVRALLAPLLASVKGWEALQPLFGDLSIDLFLYRLDCSALSFHKYLR